MVGFLFGHFSFFFSCYHDMLALSINTSSSPRALRPPGWLPQWHCGVRVSSNRKLVGFISAIPADIRIYDTWAVLTDALFVNKILTIFYTLILSYPSLLVCNKNNFPSGINKGIMICSRALMNVWCSNVHCLHPCVYRLKRMVEINFLCVHKKLRSKRVAPVLIREITRRVNLEGIFQAVYTAGVVLPKPVSTCRYASPYSSTRRVKDNITIILFFSVQVLAPFFEP